MKVPEVPGMPTGKVVKKFPRGRIFSFGHPIKNDRIFLYSYMNVLPSYTLSSQAAKALTVNDRTHPSEIPIHDYSQYTDGHCSTQDCDDIETSACERCPSRVV